MVVPDVQYICPAGHLRGKVAIVTGGGTQSDTEEIGIGSAISRLFAQAGAKVVVVDLSADNAERTCRDITGEGGDATVIVADVINTAACEEMVNVAVERLRCTARTCQQRRRPRYEYRGRSR